jgi:hypothetical protein
MNQLEALAYVAAPTVIALIIITGLLCLTSIRFSETKTDLSIDLEASSNKLIIKINIGNKKDHNKLIEP